MCRLLKCRPFFFSFAFVRIVDFVFLCFLSIFDFPFYFFLSAGEWVVMNWFKKTYLWSWMSPFHDQISSPRFPLPPRNDLNELVFNRVTLVLTYIKFYEYTSVFTLLKKRQFSNGSLKMCLWSITAFNIFSRSYFLAIYIRRRLNSPLAFTFQSEFINLLQAGRWFIAKVYEW